MWISQAVFLQVQKDLIGACAERDAIKQQQAALVNTNEWLMVRVTQLEHERAQFLFQQFGVKVAVPVLEKVPSVVDTALDMNQTISFADMGDAEAERQGIAWSDSGELMFNGRAR